MFLDDKLLEIGRNTDLSNESEIKENVAQMAQECFKNIDRIPNKNDIYSIRETFRRVANTWNKVAKQLQNEGIYLIDPDGFKNFVKDDPELQGIFNQKTE